MGAGMKNDIVDVKVDLHVHSSYSDKPFSWFLRSGHSAECYTEPSTVYETAMRRGMNLVTISDHDTIDGALELAGRYDNFFISEEVSARFPEDGCIIHTIALDIDEAQHREIQRLRGNIYDLVRYMDQEEIAYFWCHPLSDVNHRLSKSHIERCFLMFRALEVRNGTRDRLHEDHLLTMISAFTPELLARWADMYRETPFINTSARYALTGGSDDHGGVAIARSYTAFRGQPTGASLCAALREGATSPEGETGEATTLAHNCYGVAAGYFRSSGQISLQPREDGDDRQKPSMSLLSVLGRRKQLFEAAGGTLNKAKLDTEGHTSAFQDELLSFVEPALVGGWREVFDTFFAALSKGRVAEASDGISEMIKSVLVELPYILAHRYHVRDRNKAQRFYEGFSPAAQHVAGPRVAVLSDSIDNADGVSLGLRRIHLEARRWGMNFDLVGAGKCERLNRDADGIVRVPSVYDHHLAEYPQYTWSIPHLPSMLRYLTESEVDLVQCSTPGPVGFTGLLAGRLLGIPVIGQFHTDVPEYALRLTGDPAAAAMVRMIVGWFYQSMDRTLVPSRWVAKLVKDMGVATDRVVQIPRGIDLERFEQAQRDENAFAEYGLNGEPKVLYVGRISKEKGLVHLAAGFEALSREMPKARLVMVGDGPYREELAGMLPQDKVIFTGSIMGNRLAQLYASSDVFAFPSETETFGNVVVEAQATGLPVVVADRGAARENIDEGVTGLVVDPRDPDAWCRTLKMLLENAALRRQMGEAAQAFAQRYRMDTAVQGTFQEYARIWSESSAVAASKSQS